LENCKIIPCQSKKARHYNACCAQVSLKLENRDLDRRNLRSMLKISWMSCCISTVFDAICS